MAYILAIESSCDDTSCAVLKDDKVLSNVIAGQEVHSLWGGVVPELASRAHHQNIVPVVSAALEKSGVKSDEINAVAFTRGPGLLGPLLVGTSFAKAFALAKNIPLIEVNHMIAHVLAHFIDDPKPEFPFLCLTVSGGHTQIVLVKSHLEMEVLGSTIDDAAGEAFDKSAKLMGFPYPGGPLIDKYAAEGQPVFKFPKSKVGSYDFSFSGLKTAIMNFLNNNISKDSEFIAKNRADICASIQNTIIETLMVKLAAAAKEYKITHVAIAGGVSANSGLRKALKEYGQELGWQTYIPEFQYCTDNAGMIGITGYYKFLKEDFVGQEVAPLSRLKI